MYAFPLSYELIIILPLGDSGGPLMQLNSAYRYTVAGLVSFGPKNCANIVPGIYMRISEYMPWITRNIRDSAVL